MAQSHKPETIASLRAIPMFSGVSEDALESIASLMIERGFPKNKTIVEEGAPGDYMYIIVEGRVKVTKLSGDGREKILELLDVGDFFGEMSLFDEAPRSASVKAMSQVRILALARNDFLRLLSRSPDIALSVIQELTRRLRQVDEQASSLSFQRVKERTMGLLVRLAREEPGQAGRPKDSGAHPPADRRYDRNLPRDRHPRHQGPQGRGLARAGRQALPRPHSGLNSGASRSAPITGCGKPSRYRSVDSHLDEFWSRRDRRSGRSGHAESRRPAHPRLP